MNSWIMLGLAVIAEVASTVGMKYATTHSPLVGYIAMAILISFSFYAFSRALLKIPLAISYAIWEGAGLILIALAGMYFFGEQLNYKQVLAISVMTVGLLLITFDKGPAQ